ncbi:MAG: T9SS type A sorting domain-containing protein [Bacteroides sp.]|nr:T9SS type A sorting domain-containing protein [Bacteroides sp.]
MNRYISIIISVITGIAGVTSAFGSTPLITQLSQLDTNAPNANPEYSISHLLDQDPDSRFVTDNKKTDEQHYLTVSFPDGINMTDERENLVVVLTRPNRFDPNTPTVRNPTAMEVHYSIDGKNYEDDVLCRVYFINRGSGTTELSEHLPYAKLNERISKITPGKTIKDVKAMKFIVTMNNGKYIIGYDENNKGIRPMILGGFQIYIAKTGEKVVDNWIDRFHLDSDINYRYYDYKFENTQGVLNPNNRKFYGDHGLEKSTLESLEGWDNFAKTDSAEWLADEKFLQKYNIKMPDYSYITAKNDPDIKNPNLKLQRTATVEHVLYAVQGDPIILQPFYTLPEVANYDEKFIHWYDYSTGGQLVNEEGTELLDFAADPADVFRSKEYGWYAGTQLVTDDPTYKMEAVEIRNADDYKEFLRKVNVEGLRNLNAEVLDDIDFNNEELSPIGIYDNPYFGQFRGNNHTFKNLRIKNNTIGTGIFGSVTGGVLIENLIIDSSCEIDGAGWTGFVGIMRTGGSITLQGIVNHATIKSTGNIGGLLGGIESATPNDVTLNIFNCAFTGQLIHGGSEQGLVAGWLGRGKDDSDTMKITVNFKNIITCGTQTKKDNGQELYRYLASRPISYDFSGIDKNTCFDTKGYQGWNKFDISEVNTDSFLGQFNGEWIPGPNGFPISKNFATNVSGEKDVVYAEGTAPDHKYGTYATFIYPRDPFTDSGDLRTIGDEDFIIAADISINFRRDFNIKESNKTIIEPPLQFRHIFRIKDGKKFAETYMRNEEGNREFINKNLRHITAAAGTDFQVRLDFPYPVEPTTRGVFYYKIDNTDYRRICSRYFRVWKDGVLIQDRDEATGKMWIDTPGNFVEDDKAYFYASAEFKGQGEREVDGVNYYLGGGGGNFYRMMSCDSKNTQEGNYTVQVVGTDYDGHTIKLAESPDVDLLVQEFQITFLPKTAAVFATQQELEEDDDYKKITNSALIEKYGQPSDKIDFDEYRYLESLENRGDYLIELNETPEEAKADKRDHPRKGLFFRWPVSWEQSNYGFGYNQRGDYAMQMIANNQSVTPNHSLGLTAWDAKYGDGLFDRLFYDTGGTQKGYFYYVNAADDPGIIARLKLDTFCPGSTIHISCWIAEFTSNQESANLAFNFVARMQDGERIPLHSHITGYVEQGNFGKFEDCKRRGRWLYVYSSFVPILTEKEIDFSKVLHYEVELDNNSKSSLGADYAVDDIRVYTVRPIIFADQMGAVCTETCKVDVRLSADFDVLMQSMDMPKATNAAESQPIDMYYTFLDKKKYDKLISDDKVSYNEAFDKAVLRYNYDGENESYFGKLQFETYFYNNPEYDKSVNLKSTHAFRTIENGRDLIVFNTEPNDETLQSGKEYIAVILTKPQGTTFEKGMPNSSDFLVEDKCTKKCTFTVQSSHVIIIDGEVRKQSDEIDACRNQSPVVQVNLYAQKLDDEGNVIPGETELVEEKAYFDWFDGPMDEFVSIKENDITLWEAINEFRRCYPYADNLNDEPKGYYTQEMKDLLIKYSKEDPKGEVRPKLFLYKRSYYFPRLELPDGQTQTDAYVLAVPMLKYRDENHLICTQPTQVHIVVRQRAPHLAQGITGISYPPAIYDVPMRISLKQIQAATSDDSPLVLPFRTIEPVSENVTDMTLPSKGAPISLIYTNDPEFDKLEGEGKEESTLWTIGEVTSLIANKDQKETSKVALKFYPRMKFKEGYEYQMRFPFEEMTPQGTDIKDLCSGQVVFILKIVPEYQEWTGQINTNWNNDENWRRVTADDILAEDATDSKYYEYVTDGSNSRKFSYAPLDFTKVIIPQGSTVPELFNDSNELITLQGETYNWSNNPSGNPASGVSTNLVQYDMVQRVDKNVPGTFCKPWQAHSCDQIHFEPGAEIARQQHLNYNKAWVDMEVSPTRWYTLSSPLQGVVAGDMYLPSDNARQATTYFEDITFNTAAYNRFKPAVFQRSWNLASAIVYNYMDIPQHSTDVKVLTTWSNVYNDVSVPYKAGHGFSVKTDLAGVDPGESGKVKFRLPKADASYMYYTDGGSQGNATAIDRKGAHRLNPVCDIITVEAATDTNKLFLVGNPFMAHMDIAAFLEKNSAVILPKYWILDGDRQGAAVMGDALDLSGTLDEPRYVAPMQGFFVEARTAGKTLSLEYDSCMMATVNDIGAIADVQLMSHRTVSEPMALRISALESGSSAMIFVNGMARKEYDANEDVMFVSDASLEAPSLVYTVAEGTATTINALPEIFSTEIGVMAAEGEETTLLFEGVDSSSGLMIYDAADDSYTELCDGMELKVNGPSSRRLYIVNGVNITGQITSELEITLMSNAVRVTSAQGGLSANIYDISGRMLESYTEGGTEVIFELSKGIYIVEAVDAVSKKTQKVMIK